MLLLFHSALCQTAHLSVLSVDAASRASDGLDHNFQDVSHIFQSIFEISPLQPILLTLCVCVCVCACVRACGRACVRVGTHACVHAHTKFVLTVFWFFAL